MPLINYECECKHVVRKAFRRPNEIPSTVVCEKCGKDMKKLLSSPSSSSKITVDNGFQARAVEITPDIIEINEERSRKNYREE